MRDYRIIVEGQGNYARQTSPKRETTIREKVKPVTEDVKKYHEAQHNPSYRRIAAVGLATAMKINSYVGELTENGITQKRNQTGLTLAGLLLTAVYSPSIGIPSMGIYIGDKIATYSINNYKQNLSASYLRTLSGGTVSTGR